MENSSEAKLKLCGNCKNYVTRYKDKKTSEYIKCFPKEDAGYCIATMTNQHSKAHKVFPHFKCSCHKFVNII